VRHIALVIPGFAQIGGAERQVQLLARGLCRRGWRVTVVALSGAEEEAGRELFSAGAEFLSLEMRKGLADPRGWIRFNRWLRRERPDVVHGHMPHAAWMVRWSRLGAPVRAVLDTIHTSSTGTVGRRIGYRWSDWLPDRVTAVSRATADAYLGARMVSAQRLAVLPNGVDLEAWRPDAAVRAAVRRELGLTDEFLWLATGRLEPVKDYPTLLRAMVGLAPSARLVVAGAGCLEGELRGLTMQLGLERRVRFMGFEPNVCRWMQAADGFVLSSRLEGLPLVLLEAAACGLPSVATDVPGTPEVVDDGVTGWLAPPADPDALQAAMIRMMKLSPEERAAMGARARQRVTDQFGLEAVLDRWEALYGELLEQNPVARRWGRFTSAESRFF
jgi:glycosyltransferase involved in cell wall biosynthesis